MRVYNMGLRTRPQRDPGAETLVRGSGEAVSFLTDERPQEAANLPHLLYFAKSVNQRSPNLFLL